MKTKNLITKSTNSSSGPVCHLNHLSGKTSKKLCQAYIDEPNLSQYAGLEYPNHGEIKVEINYRIKQLKGDENLSTILFDYVGVCLGEIYRLFLNSKEKDPLIERRNMLLSKSLELYESKCEDVLLQMKPIHSIWDKTDKESLKWELSLEYSIVSILGILMGITYVQQEGAPKQFVDKYYRRYSKMLRISTKMLAKHIDKASFTSEANNAGVKIAIARIILSIRNSEKSFRMLGDGLKLSPDMIEIHQRNKSFKEGFYRSLS